MVNKSNVRSTLQWDKWRRAGAVGGVHEAVKRARIHVRPWHVNGLFLGEKTNLVLAIPRLTNLGIFAPKKFTIVHSYLRGKVPPLSTWKYEGATSGAGFYRLPSGALVVVKPELEVFQPQATRGREDSNQVKHILPVLTELVARRARIETPVGLLVAKNGDTFYVTRKREGHMLRSGLPGLSPRGRVELAKSMGRELADLHNKGVVHGHPHAGNWLVQGRKARLIDSKLVTFKDEYPYTFKTNGRVVTWIEQAHRDMLQTRTELNAYGLFDMERPFSAAYKKARKKEPN